MLFRVLIIFILGTFCGFFLCQLVLKKEMKRLTEKLRSIRTSKSNERLLASIGQIALADFIREVNLTLDEEVKNNLFLEEKGQLLRQSMTNMSHDLRTPLTSILGYLKLATQPDIAEDEQRRYLEVVKNKSLNLQQLIEQFFLLSRVESEIVQVKQQPTELTAILQEVIAGYYEDFIQQDIQPVIEMPENAVWCLGDEDALRRVFNNLLQNMIKHEGKSAEIKLAYDMNKKWILVYFTNNVTNLNQAEAERFFERFYTADRMRSGQNTGLGLSIVKELVEKMGGAATASVLEKENRFTIVLRLQVAVEK